MIKTLFLNKTAALKKPKSQSFLFKSKSRRKDSLKKEKLVNLESTKKLSLKKHKTLLIANFYEAALPVFKSFILIFEQKTPQVHKLLLKLPEVTRDFFVCILKHESIKGLTGWKLKKLNIKNELRKAKYFFIGASNEKSHES